MTSVSVPMELVRDALALAFHSLGENPSELPAQLCGRLFGAESEGVKTLLQEISASTDWPWLRPLRPALHPAGGPLTMPLVGHSGAVTCLALDSQRHGVVSGSMDGTLRVWDLRSGGSRVLAGHRDGVTCLAHDRNRQIAVSGSSDGTLRMWDLTSGHSREFVGHGGAITCLALRPEARLVVSGSEDKSLRVWDLTSGTCRVLEGHQKPVACVAFAPAHNCIVSGSLDGLRVWDLSRGACLIVGGSARVDRLALDPAGRFAVVGTWQRGTLRVQRFSRGPGGLALGESKDLKPEEQTPDGPLRAGGAVHFVRDADTCLALDPTGGRVIAGYEDKLLRTWDLARGGFALLRGHTDAVTCVTFTPRGSRAISGARDGELRVWSPADKASRVLEAHTAEVTCLAVDAAETLLVSGSKDQTLRVWDLLRGTSRSIEKHPSRVTSLALASGGKRVASGSADGSLRVWNRPCGTSTRVFSGHSAKITCIALYWAGRRMVSGSDDGLCRGWEVVSGSQLESHHIEGRLSAGVLGWPSRRWLHGMGESERERRELIAAADWFETYKGATCLAFDPDCNHAIVGSNRALGILDVTTGALRRLGPSIGPYGTCDITCAALAARGQLALLGGQDRRLWIWDLASDEPRRVEGHTDSILCLALDISGRVALSGSKDRTVRLWDVARGTSRVLAWHSGPVTCVAFHHAGRQAVSGSDDNTLSVWDLAGQGQRSHRVAAFSNDAATAFTAVAADSHCIVAGDLLGRLHVLRL